MPEKPEDLPSFSEIYNRFMGNPTAPKIEPSQDIRELAGNFAQFVQALTDQGFTRKESIETTTAIFTKSAPPQ